MAGLVPAIRSSSFQSLWLRLWPLSEEPTALGTAAACAVVPAIAVVWIMIRSLSDFSAAGKGPSGRSSLHYAGVRIARAGPGDESLEELEAAGA